MSSISKKKKLLINMVTCIVAYAVSLGVSFILSPFLVETVGKETYSFYSISHTISVYMTVITTALNNMSTRFVTLEIVKKNYKNANDYFKSVFIINIVICLILLIPMMAIVVFLEHFMNVPPQSLFDIKLLFALTFLSMLIKVLSSMLGIATVATDRLDLRSYRTIGDGILKLILYIVFYSIFKPYVFIMGVVLVLEAVYTFLVQLAFTKKLLPEIKLGKGTVNKVYAKELFGSSIWSACTSLGNHLLLGATVVLANIFISEQASGYIAISNTLIGFIGGIITTVIGVFLPRLLAKKATENKTAILEEILSSQKMLAVFSNTIMAGVVIMGKTFFELWMPTVDSDILYQITVVLCIPYFAVGNFWTIYNMTTVLNKVKIPAIELLIMGGANIVLCAIAAKMFGAQQIHLCIITCVLSLINSCIFVPVYIGRCMDTGVKKFYVTPLKSVITFLVCIVAGKYLYTGVTVRGWTGFFVCAIIFGIGIVAINTIVLYGDELLKGRIKCKFKKTSNQ